MAGTCGRRQCACCMRVARMLNALFKFLVLGVGGAIPALLATRTSGQQRGHTASLAPPTQSPHTSEHWQPHPPQVISAPNSEELTMLRVCFLRFITRVRKAEVEDDDPPSRGLIRDIGRPYVAVGHPTLVHFPQNLPHTDQRLVGQWRQIKRLPPASGGPTHSRTSAWIRSSGGPAEPQVSVEQPGDATGSLQPLKGMVAPDFPVSAPRSTEGLHDREATVTQQHLKSDAIRSIDEIPQDLKPVLRKPAPLIRGRNPSHRRVPGPGLRGWSHAASQVVVQVLIAVFCGLIR